MVANIEKILRTLFSGAGKQPDEVVGGEDGGEQARDGPRREPRRAQGAQQEVEEIFSSMEES